MSKKPTKSPPQPSPVQVLPQPLMCCRLHRVDKPMQVQRRPALPRSGGQAATRLFDEDGNMRLDLPGDEWTDQMLCAVLSVKASAFMAGEDAGMERVRATLRAELGIR